MRVDATPNGELHRDASDRFPSPGGEGRGEGERLSNCIVPAMGDGETSSAGPERRGGFTLIELMVVMILIGILSAMILPEMKGTFGDALLRSSARDLVNVFALANSRAVSLNQIHVVRLDLQNHKYSVERRVRGQGKRPEFAPLKDVTGSSGQLDERITVELRKRDPGAMDADQPQGSPAPKNEMAEVPQDSVMFYPDGTADGTEVLLRDRAGNGLRLQISPITARIEVTEVSPR